MAHDEDLADRLRALLAGERGITEKRMFGGQAFLLGGHLLVAASGKGGLLARIDPDDAEAALARPGAAPMVMRGRPLVGWLRVEPDAVRTKRDLSAWVKRSLSFVRGLPPK